MADRCPRCNAKGYVSGASPCGACGWQDPLLEPWVPAGWYPDPADAGRARYWGGRAWTGKPREDVKPREIPTEAPPVPASAIVARDTVAVLERCAVLGGYGLGARAGTKVDMRFRTASLDLLSSEGVLICTVPYGDIASFEIGGPGAHRKGGGFIGGGFGAQGATEGMLIASALNLLTTRTKVDTVICLQTASSELFLHTTADTPDAIRIRLSRVFSAIRERRGAAQAAATSSTSPDDPIEQLERLIKLRDAGGLSDEEFEAARAPLVARLTQARAE